MGCLPKDACKMYLALHVTLLLPMIQTGNLLNVKKVTIIKKFHVKTLFERALSSPKKTKLSLNIFGESLVYQ